jgi:hypothetical protein
MIGRTESKLDLNHLRGGYRSPPTGEAAYWLGWKRVGNPRWHSGSVSNFCRRLRVAV